MNENEIKSFIETDILVDINLEEKKFNEWCKNNYLNTNIINYVKDYLLFMNNLYKKEQDLGPKDYDDAKQDVKLDWFDEHLKIHIRDHNQHKNISYALLHGFGYNIVKKLEKTNLFIATMDPNPENIYALQWAIKHYRKKKGI